MPVEIVSLSQLGDMFPVVDLQRNYWGADAEAVVPAHMLFSITTTGGHVLAAQENGQSIGAVIGLVGYADAPDVHTQSQLYIFSKRMVVLPNFRDEGLGYRLKMAQREVALARGIRQVVWTFDPLLSRNAYLNLRKLGAQANLFKQDAYGGYTSGGLSSFGMSDRLYLNWYLDVDEVQARANHTFTPMTLGNYLERGYPLLNLSTLNADGWLVPPVNVLPEVAPICLFEIPSNYPEIEKSDLGLAYQWRVHVRQHLQRLMLAGYVVVDFVRGTLKDVTRSLYVLESR